MKVTLVDISASENEASHASTFERIAEAGSCESIPAYHGSAQSTIQYYRLESSGHRSTMPKCYTNLNSRCL